MNTPVAQVAEAEPRPLPRSFILELTRRCNNHCGYCYNIWRAPGGTEQRPSSTPSSEHSPERSSPSPTGEMTLQEIKQVILKLQEETQVTSLSLSGGEPTLHPDFVEIVQFIRSRGIIPLIVTNGSGLTEAMVEATAEDSLYEVPLLSWRPEMHDRLVGRHGAWDAVVDGMSNIHVGGGHMTAVFVATRLNYADLAATISMAMLLGIESFLYNRVNVGAANLHHAAELFPTPAMIAANLFVLEDIAAQTGLPISMGVVIEPCVVDTRQFPHLNNDWCSLAGEDAAFVIDPTGNIRICGHSPVVLGNILRDRFADIYEHHPYLEAFRATLPQECTACEHPLRNSCQGGCKSAAEQVYGALTHVDPFVTMNR